MKPGNRHEIYRLQFLKRKCMCNSQHCSYLQKKELSTFSNDLEWYQTDGDRMHVREAPFWTVLVLYLGKKVLQNILAPHFHIKFSQFFWVPPKIFFSWVPRQTNFRNWHGRRKCSDIFQSSRFQQKTTIFVQLIAGFLRGENLM